VQDVREYLRAHDYGHCQDWQEQSAWTDPAEHGELEWENGGVDGEG
jgi:hypothetical protein